jgi:hypothetical protein
MRGQDEVRRPWETGEFILTLELYGVHLALIRWPVLHSLRMLSDIGKDAGGRHLIRIRLAKVLAFWRL